MSNVLKVINLIKLRRYRVVSNIDHPKIMNDFFHISSLKENCELAMAAFNEINHFNDYRQKRLEYI